jgi:hypothetical protein
MTSERPVCEVCGKRASVVPDPTRMQYAAWCGCELTAPSDPQHRGVGYGDTREAAIEAWRDWKRDR